MTRHGPTPIVPPLARRNPTVLLALLFVVSVVLLFVFDPLTPAVIYSVALAAVAAGSRLRPRALFAAQLPFIGFALGLLVVNALSRPGTVLVAFAGLRVTEQGLSVGAALALRTLSIGVLSAGFLAAADGVRLMTSLHQHARLGARVTFALLAGYRMLQSMPQDWAVIRHAQSVRAPLDARGRPRSGLGAFCRAAFSLLVVSLRHSEKMALALESRGLGLSPRSTWRPVPLSLSDALFAAGVLATLGAIIATSAAFGALQGAGALG